MKNNRPPLRAVVPFLLAATFAALLSGCGGGGGGDAGSASSSPAGTAVNILPTIPPMPIGGTSGGTTGPSTQACTTAPALFTSTVGPSIGSICATCHISGGLAGGTKLVFSAGGATVNNYNVLRNYVLATGGATTLLGKTIGQPSHTGGAPYVDATSQPYMDMQTLISQISQNCTTSGGGTATPQSGFWAGVTFTDNTTAINKAAVLFAGRNATQAEIDTANGGGDAALRGVIRGYMTGTTFDRFLTDASDTQFLTPGVVVFGTGGLDAKDWPSAAAVITNATGLPSGVRGRFQSSIRREPIELVKFIVKNERPWTEVVSGDYTVVNGLLQQYLNATVQGTFKNTTDDNEWLPARLPSERLGGTREHSGVLSTHAWLNRFPTTPTNRNRHRINLMLQQFLATNILALGTRPLPGAVNPFPVPTMQDPNCTVCHATMDPMAAGFQNWNEDNRFLPVHTDSGHDIALPSSYRSGNYPKDASGKAYYQDGDNWFRDDALPGFNTLAMPGGYTGNPMALQWLGQQVSTDARFSMGAVYFWFQAVFGRAPLAAPTDPSSPQYATQLAAYNAQNDELTQIAARFPTNRGSGPYNVRDLLVDLVTSSWFRANGLTSMAAGRTQELADVGSVNLLLPAQLNLKLQGLTGQSFSAFSNPYAGAALNYGDFDGRTRQTRMKSYTMIQTTTAERMAVTTACNAAMNDFNQMARVRTLFPDVELTTTPADTAGQAAIVQNIQFLHKTLLKEDLPAADAEIQRTYQLFMDIWNDRANKSANQVACAFNDGNDPNYTGRAWSAILVYMIGDDKFLYE
jgi:hypothetical protein